MGKSTISMAIFHHWVPADLQVMGMYPGDPGDPGLDCSGTVGMPFEMTWAGGCNGYNGTTSGWWLKPRKIYMAMAQNY